MNILVSVDSNFLIPLETLLYSLSKTQSAVCNIYFLNISLTNEEILELKTLCQKLQLNFNSIDIPSEIIEVLKRKKKELLEEKLSIETYARLFAPYLFPTLDRILWLDADCLIQKDLHDFYFQDLKDYTISACDHCNWILPEVPEYSYWEYPLRKEKPEHFNAGVILFNLNQCRKIRGFQKDNMIKIILKSEKTFFDFFDQSILNYLCPPDRVKWESPLQFNCFINRNWEGGFRDHPIQNTIYKNAFILHYCSHEKPWDLTNNLNYEARKIWLRVYSQLINIKNV